MKRAVIYARFSSENQRDDSIEIQTRECKALIDREGWTLTQVYADYAMTGTNDERPGFKNCLADGLADRYDILVIYKGDRLARNVAIAQDFKNQLFRAGKRIVSVREGEFTDTPDSFLLGGIGDLFAEYYSRNLSVLVKGGIAQNARNCKASGQRYYGYDVDKEDHFVINKKEAEIVEEIYNDYITGASYKTIAEMLNKRSITNKYGKPWCVRSVLTVLSQKRYTGEYNYAGIVIPDGMPRIISDETFELAQNVHKTRRINRRDTSVYLLTDKTYCLDCGGSVNGRSCYNKNKRKYRYYGCNSKTKCCSLPASLVEDTVVEAVYGLVKSKYMDDLIESTLTELKNQAVPASLINRDKIDAFIRATLDKGVEDRDTAYTITKQFVDKIYMNNTQIIVEFLFGVDDIAIQVAPENVPRNAKHPNNCELSGCSYDSKWLTTGTGLRIEIDIYDTGFVLKIKLSYTNNKRK